MATLARASFDELVAFYTTSTIASGSHPIIIFSPPPAGALLDGDGRCACPRPTRRTQPTAPLCNALLAKGMLTVPADPRSCMSTYWKQLH